MSSRQTPNHWLIRVNDGVNFRNSKHPFWGVKRCHKTTVEKIEKGDILWFMTSKPHGGKLIGMSEYIESYDRQDEQLISIYTYSNKDQNWEGDEDWDIQLHYKNLYNTEKQDIKAVIQCAGVILNYKTFNIKGTAPHGLYNHYDNFKYYAEPKKF